MTEEQIKALAALIRAVIDYAKQGNTNITNGKIEEALVQINESGAMK